jgi:hypothetical protein
VVVRYTSRRTVVFVLSVFLVLAVTGCGEPDQAPVEPEADSVSEAPVAPANVIRRVEVDARRLSFVGPDFADYPNNQYAEYTFKLAEPAVCEVIVTGIGHRGEGGLVEILRERATSAGTCGTLRFFWQKLPLPEGLKPEEMAPVALGTAFRGWTPLLLSSRWELWVGSEGAGFATAGNGHQRFVVSTGVDQGAGGGSVGGLWWGEREVVLDKEIILGGNSWGSGVAVDGFTDEITREETAKKSYSCVFLSVRFTAP